MQRAQQVREEVAAAGSCERRRGRRRAGTAPRAPAQLPRQPAEGSLPSSRVPRLPAAPRGRAPFSRRTLYPSPPWCLWMPMDDDASLTPRLHSSFPCLPSPSHDNDTHDDDASNRWRSSPRTPSTSPSPTAARTSRAACGCCTRCPGPSRCAAEPYLAPSLPLSSLLLSSHYLAFKQPLFGPLTAGPSRRAVCAMGRSGDLLTHAL